MNSKMKYLLILVFVIGFANTLQAAPPVLNNPSIPYEVLTMKSQIEARQIYYGELSGDPHSFEFSLGKDTDLVVDLSQLNNSETVPFSIIAVKSNDNNRGVVEMGRVSGEDGVWTTVWDSVFGLSLKRAETFKLELGPGLYKLEISSPNNLGKYMMEVGSINTDGYFSTVSGIRKIQKFFDYSVFRMLLSSYVYYPVGIALLAVLFFLTWRNRNRIPSVIKND